MSAELMDLRVKITIEADCCLDAEARTTGKDKSEIVREILKEWAAQRIHAARLLDKLLRNEGEAGITERRAGKSGE